MIDVKFITFIQPRRDRCRFCGQRISVNTLALFTNDEQVVAELDICQGCKLYLEVITGKSEGRGRRSGRDEIETEMMMEEV